MEMLTGRPLDAADCAWHSAGIANTISTPADTATTRFMPISPAVHGCSEAQSMRPAEIDGRRRSRPRVHPEAVPQRRLGRLVLPVWASPSIASAVRRRAGRRPGPGGDGKLIPQPPSTPRDGSPHRHARRDDEHIHNRVFIPESEERENRQPARGYFAERRS